MRLVLCVPRLFAIFQPDLATLAIQRPVLKEACELGVDASVQWAGDLPGSGFLVQTAPQHAGDLPQCS